MALSVFANKSSFFLPRCFCPLWKERTGSRGKPSGREEVVCVAADKRC